MKKAILFCTLAFLSFINTSNAHNPLSAVYYLEVKKDLTILNISLSQAGLNEGLIKFTSNPEIFKIPITEYKKLAVKYIKLHFSLSINESEIKLLEGGMKLGSHQTNFKFITSEIPKELKTLSVNINAFEENENHQTIFSLLLNGISSKVILSKKNDFKSDLEFKDYKMVVVNNNSKKYFWFLLAIPFFIIGRKTLNKLKTNKINSKPKQS